MTGRVIGVQVGAAGVLSWRRHEIPTAIVKHVVDGRVPVGFDGMEDDEQADLTVHGGPDKAICCYPAEHLADWRERLGLDLPPSGAFGENLTLAGLTERDVHIGDVMRIGDVTAEVSQPRGPCFKLAVRWGRRDLPALMAKEGRSGFYLRVLQPGTIGAGDAAVRETRVSEISVAEVMRVTYRDRHDVAAVEAVLEVAALAPQWRDALGTFRARRKPA